MQAYSALLADMREALINERTLLAAHDAREDQLRHTKAAANAALEDGLGASEDVEMRPEHEILFEELYEKRNKLIEGLDGRAVKSVRALFSIQRQLLMGYGLDLGRYD